jgi:hypothetical protein
VRRAGRFLGAAARSGRGRRLSPCRRRGHVRGPAGALRCLQRRSPPCAQRPLQALFVTEGREHPRAGGLFVSFLCVTPERLNQPAQL